MQVMKRQQYEHGLYYFDGDDLFSKTEYELLLFTRTNIPNNYNNYINNNNSNSYSYSSNNNSNSYCYDNNNNNKTNNKTNNNNNNNNNNYKIN